MLSELAEARYAARLAEADRRRRLRELTAARGQRLRRLGLALRLPRPRRSRPTACATAR
jgi:hypothetical protein